MIRNKGPKQITLEDQFSVKAYLRAKGVKIYTVDLPPNIPTPDQAVMYSRYHSKQYLDALSEGEIKEKRDAKRAISEFYDTILKERDVNAKSYMTAFYQVTQHYGQRLADETRKTQSRVKRLTESRKELSGKLATIFDYVGFRGGGSFAVYNALNNSLKDVHIDLPYGVKINGPDIAALGFVGSMIGTTVASDRWRKSREDRIWKGLRKKTRRMYEEVAFQAAELFQRYYPDNIEGLKPTGRVNGYGP